MWLSSKRPHYLNYAVNNKRVNSSDKVQSTIKHYLRLQKRIAFEGMTKWLSNAQEIVLKKLKKYGINPNKLTNA